MRHSAIYIQFFFCLIVSSCNDTPDKTSFFTDLNAANLKGNVYRVKETFNKVGDLCCPAGDKSECSQIITIYDVNGYTVQSAKIGVNGDTINQSIHIYNEKKECVTVENFADGNLISREINNLDNGLVKAVKIIDYNGNVLNIHKFSYDRGQLIGGSTSNHAGQILNFFENKYKEGRIETEISKDSDVKIFSITSYKRNSQGDVIEAIVNHPRDTSVYTLRYEYEYDKMGNWTKQKKIYNDDIISIRIRDIEYFPDDL